MNSSTPTRLAKPTGIVAAAKLALMRSMSSVPRACQSTNMPSRKPASPMRLTMNAFLPAAAFSGSSNQNPISRYDARPTPSQPTNSTSSERPSTSSSMKNRNRLRYAK